MAVRLQESLIKLLKTDTINSHSSGVGLTIASSDALSLSSASSKDLNITSGNNLYIKSAANKNIILSAGATATEVARASEKGNFVVGGDNQTQTTYRFYVTGKTGLAGTSSNLGHLYLTGSGSNSIDNTTQIVFGTPTAEHIAISANENKALILNPTSSTNTNQIVLYLNQHSLFPSGISTHENVTNATSATTGAIITQGGIGVGKDIFSTGRYTSKQAGARYIVNNNTLKGWFGFSENGEWFGIYDITNKYYLIQNTTKTTGGGVSLGSASQNTTVLGNLTVDKNTTLKGSLTLNGSLTHNGKYLYQSGDATMTFYPQDNDTYGNESIAIQTCFDDQDGETSSYVTTHENRCNLLLQPRGGQVYIGENLLTVGDTNYSLIVNGKTCLSNNIAYANGASTNYDIIKFIAGTNDGAGIVIGGGGLAIFGSGESASNVQSKGGSSGAAISGGTEQTYITSDGGIDFITNCQSWDSRKTISINTAGQIVRAAIGTSWWSGRDVALIRQNTSSGYAPILSMKTTNGSWELGHYNSNSWHDDFLFNYKDDTSYASGSSDNTVIHAARLSKDGYLTLANGLLVNGTARFAIGSSDAVTNKRFIIGTSGRRYLSMGGAGIQAYLADNTAGTLYVQHEGGVLDVGSTSATGTFRGEYEFVTADGFTYTGIGSASDNVARPIWFSYNGITGRPVYHNSFKFNPSAISLSLTRGSYTTSLAVSSDNATYLTTGSTLYISSAANTSLIFRKGTSAHARFDTNGHLIPEATTTYNLGSSSLKWNNIYAGTTHGVHNGNIKGVVESTGSTYSPLFINTGGSAAVNTTEYTRRANKDFKIAIAEGTTSALGYVRLDLGNATSSGTAGNKYGRLRLYNQDTTFSDILGNSVGSYGNLRVTGARGGYHGILFGDATSGMAIMSVDGSHQGLHNQAQSKWIIYHNGSGSICIGGSTVATNYPIVLNAATKQIGTFWSTGNIWGNHFYPNTDLTYDLGSTSYRYNNMYGHQLYLSGATNATMTAASTNPRITFAESTNTQPVHLIYTDYNDYRSPAGLKVIGGTEATPAWFEVEGALIAGGAISTSSTITASGAISTSSTITANGSITSKSAFYANKAGTSQGFYVRSNGTNVAHLYQNTRGTAGDGTNAGTAGYVYLMLGNNTAQSSAANTGAENAYGILRIYGTSSGYTQIRTGTNNTSGYTLYLPGASGQIVYHTNDTKIGSENVPVYIAATGAATACSSLWTNSSTSSTQEFQVGARSAAGTIYMYSQGDATKNRGLYGANNAGTAVSILTVDKNNKVSLNGNASTASSATYSSYLGNSTNKFVAGYSSGVLLTAQRNGTASWAIERNGDNQWLTAHFYNASGTWLSGKRLWMQGDAITGAVWNDYAEYRESDCIEPGYVLSENGDDSLSKTQQRLSHFAGVSSDTWGFCQGETEKAKTPIAVAGRVLVYTYQNRENYRPGDCVCAAPNGTVDLMTREEIIQYPDRIVGTVSCVPTYETWGSGDRAPVQVNGRIWIKVI